MYRTRNGFQVFITLSKFGVVSAFLFLSSCKPVEQELKVKVDTGSITEVGYSFSIIQGNIVDIGEGKIDQHGFCYGLSESPTIFDDNTQLGSRTTTGSFSDSLLNLLGGSAYFVRAYAQAAEEIIYGDQTSFTTLTPTSPVVVIDSVGEFSNDSVKISSKVTDNGGSNVTAHGVCWSLEENPSTSGNHTSDGEGVGSFTSFITGLERDTTYYIRAYATSAAATSYSDQHQVSTPPVTIEVTTTAVSGITMTAAVSGGTVTAGEGAEITARGVCWNTTENPDLTGNHTTDGTGVGSFSSSITGLSAGTTYYVRAYATGSSGTYYGEQLSFTTTSQSASLPVLTTSAVSGITENAAVSGGSITDDGGSAVSARGVCWSTSHNPDLSDGFTTDGIGIGSFTSSITGLSSNTTYYVRSYATNGAGTSFGNEQSFTTSQSLFMATLTTATVTSITETSAVGGGNISDDGGSSITVRGVCWSISAGPEISDDFTAEGSGTGVFTSSLSGLSPNTTYYVRAYATNGEGTAYGNEVSFQTNSSASLPAISTITANSIATNGAKSGGIISDDGGSTVISRGVCWSISHNPDLTGDHTTDGGGVGSFTSNITGLDPNTTYYVRAYATNATGTSYGNEVSFITLDLGDAVTDIDGNVYQTVEIGTQTWFSENLKTTHFTNGDQIPQLTDILDWTADQEGAYCFFDNNIANFDTYGILYNWYAIEDTRNLCPTGWHVPAIEEWDALFDFVGGLSVAGAKLKEEGTEHWSSSNYATNEYGFTALPAGWRTSNGTFSSLSHYGRWWSSSPSFNDYANAREMTAGNFEVWTVNSQRNYGSSIRCLKD